MLVASLARGEACGIYVYILDEGFSRLHVVQYLSVFK